MNLPYETLKRQLEAAYVALETLGRERAKGTAALNDMQAKLQLVGTELDAERARAAALAARLTEFRLAYDIVVDTLAKATIQLNDSTAARDSLFLQLQQVSNDLVTTTATRDVLTKADKATTKADSDAQFELLRNELAAIAASLAQVESTRRDLANTLSSVYASRSWRVTKPMRAAVNFVRELPSTVRRTRTILPPWLRRNFRCAGNATLNLLLLRGAGWRARFTIRPRSPDR
jgi:hypothetical protein